MWTRLSAKKLETPNRSRERLRRSRLCRPQPRGRARQGGLDGAGFDLDLERVNLLNRGEVLPGGESPRTFSLRWWRLADSPPRRLVRPRARRMR